MPDDQGDTQTSGFTEEERNELRQLIAEAVGAGQKPSEESAARAKVKPATDEEFDKMSDRQRENHIRQIVDGILAELSRDDEIARQRREIDALKQTEKPEPEKPPSIVTRMQRWLWGEDK